MKHSRNIGFGLIGLVLAGAGIGAGAETIPDKYAPLRAALASKKQEAIVGAEDARYWAEEYEAYLNDPETATDEKPGLRKTVIEEKARYQKLTTQARQIQAAIHHLRRIPNDQGFTLAELQEAYHGLADLGARGRAAWSQLLRDRETVLGELEENYARELAASTAVFEGLDTEERANRLLLNAIDPHRSDSTDAEFHVALKLPSIKSVVELGFGISGQAKNPNLQAQTTLIALIAYSQFFWDHYAGVREQLGEGEFPSDSARNIFGVADGGVLTSDAIVEYHSSQYYLSEEAKERFNSKLRAIWGSEGSIAVSRWDQNRATAIGRACRALSTTSEKSLVPNQQAFDLLAEIEIMIDEKEQVAKAIQDIRSRFQEERAVARAFGERAALSSSHFNAELWASSSKQAIAGFESAFKLLDQQLDESANEDWIPKLKGITASAQALRKTHSRLDSVRVVKRELAALLQ